jgi:hypothetical protein
VIGNYRYANLGHNLQPIESGQYLIKTNIEATDYSDSLAIVNFKIFLIVSCKEAVRIPIFFGYF